MLWTNYKNFLIVLLIISCVGTMISCQTLSPNFFNGKNFTHKCCKMSEFVHLENNSVTCRYRSANRFFNSSRSRSSMVNLNLTSRDLPSGFPNCEENPFYLRDNRERKYFSVDESGQAYFLLYYRLIRIPMKNYCLDHLSLVQNEPFGVNIKSDQQAVEVAVAVFCITPRMRRQINLGWIVSIGFVIKIFTRSLICLIYLLVYNKLNYADWMMFSFLIASNGKDVINVIFSVKNYLDYTMPILEVTPSSNYFARYLVWMFVGVSFTNLAIMKYNMLMKFWRNEAYNQEQLNLPKLLKHLLLAWTLPNVVLWTASLSEYIYGPSSLWIKLGFVSALLLALICLTIATFVVIVKAQIVAKFARTYVETKTSKTTSICLKFFFSAELPTLLVYFGTGLGILFGNFRTGEPFAIIGVLVLSISGVFLLYFFGLNRRFIKFLRLKYYR